MVRVLLLKLNGWPQWFDERIDALAGHVDEVVLVRPKPTQGPGDVESIGGVRTYNLRPARGRFVTPGWLQPVIFPLHVLQAILLALVLYLRGELPPVIHALDYALGGMAGSVIARVCGGPLVVSVRGLKDSRFKTIPDAERTLRARLNHRILQGMTRFVFTNADHIVTKAAYQVEFVRETCEVDAGFTTLPTGVDFDLFDPDSDVIRPRFPDDVARQVNEDDDVVVYLSTLIPKKGPDQILRLLAAVDDLPEDLIFVFIGEFRDDDFERECRRLLEPVAERVVLRPEPVPFETVPNVLARVDATILLSEAETEGVPRILQESCAMGTPIIGADVAGIGDAFRGLPGCHLISREDPDAFASAVEAATDDSVEMPREVFADRFDMHANYGQYASIYERLAGQQE